MYFSWTGIRIFSKETWFFLVCYLCQYLSIIWAHCYSNFFFMLFSVTSHSHSSPDFLCIWISFLPPGEHGCRRRLSVSHHHPSSVCVSRLTCLPSIHLSVYLSIHLSTYLPITSLSSFYSCPSSIYPTSPTRHKKWRVWEYDLMTPQQQIY